MRFVVFWDPSDPPCRMRNAHLGPALKLLRHSWERGPNRPNSARSNSFWVFCTRQHDYCKLQCHPVSKSVSVRLWCRLFVKITVSFVAWVDENETTTLLPVQSVHACKSTLTHRYPHWRHAAQLQTHLYWPDLNQTCPVDKCKAKTTCIITCDGSSPRTSFKALLGLTIQ